MESGEREKSRSLASLGMTDLAEGVGGGANGVVEILRRERRSSG